MSTPIDPTLDSEIVDITTRRRRHRNRRLGRFKWIVLALVATFFILWRAIYIYVESLWYGSLGFASRFWYVVELRWGLFLVFGVATFAILLSGFRLLERWFRVDKIAPRTIYVDKRPVELNVFRYLRPIGWGIAIFFGLIFGLSYSADWNIWVLFLDQPPTAATDPIFGRTIGFYIFTLPVYDLITEWLLTIGIILTVATLVFGVLSIVPDQAVMVDEKRTTFQGFGEQAYSAVSITLAVLMVLIAADTFLSRYEYLTVDHQSFSGVTFSEANYLIPGLTIV